MASLDVVRNQIRVRAYFAVSHASPQLQSVLRSTSPRVTGNLQGKTSVTPRGLEATAKAATPYASFVKDGTRPHTIRPKRGRVLSFYWPNAPGGARRVWLPKVNHPGTKGNQWWDTAIGKWPDYLREGLRRAP